MNLSAIWTLPAAWGLATAAAAATVIALCAVHAMARRERAALAGALDASRRLTEAAQAAVTELRTEVATLRHQLEQLEHRQERLSSAGSHSGFRQAIALCRHGASTRELVDSCGLSEGEAQLVYSLYGRMTATTTQDADLH